MLYRNMLAFDSSHNIGASSWGSAFSSGNFLLLLSIVISIHRLWAPSFLSMVRVLEENQQTLLLLPLCISNSTEPNCSPSLLAYYLSLCPRNLRAEHRGHSIKVHVHSCCLHDWVGLLHRENFCMDLRQEIRLVAKWMQPLTILEFHFHWVLLRHL